ncbi:uncharacterized protein LOC120685110 [Panicum virgatum]|uniref:uncharacterized protein LOC120685110 n=1 Tax=Panicum virgatum TaxID=38727 RepID=UPI0019D57B4B|nr:uncharacterized protein LOC120685110 [Panicum virgatum]
MAEYWKESVARPGEVMLLRYEHLKEDAVGTLRRLAEFLCCPFADEEVASGVPKVVAALCGLDRMKMRPDLLAALVLLGHQQRPPGGKWAACPAAGLAPRAPAIRVLPARARRWPLSERELARAQSPPPPPVAAFSLAPA